MPAPEFPETEADFLGELNGNAYNVSTNPYGMAQGGHRQLWATAMNYMATIAGYVRDALTYLSDLADQVADDAASAAAGSGTEASVANIRAGADVAHYVSMRRVLAANVPVALTDAATIAWDMTSGINFTVTLGAAGRTLANPTGQIAGKNGILTVKQDATGSRSITTWGDDFIWIGGEPVWPSAANARSHIAYFVEADGTVILQFAGSSA